MLPELSHELWVEVFSWLPCRFARIDPDNFRLVLACTDMSLVCKNWNWHEVVVEELYEREEWKQLHERELGWMLRFDAEDELILKRLAIYPEEATASKEDHARFTSVHLPSGSVMKFAELCVGRNFESGREEAAGRIKDRMLETRHMLELLTVGMRHQTHYPEYDAYPEHERPGGPQTFGCITAYRMVRIEVLPQDDPYHEGYEFDRLEACVKRDDGTESWLKPACPVLLPIHQALWRRRSASVIGALYRGTPSVAVSPAQEWLYSTEMQMRVSLSSMAHALELPSEVLSWI